MEKRKEFEYYRSIGESNYDRYYEDFVQDNAVFESRLKSLDYEGLELIKVLNFFIDKLEQGTRHLPLINMKACDGYLDEVYHYDQKHHWKDIIEGYKAEIELGLLINDGQKRELLEPIDSILTGRFSLEELQKLIFGIYEKRLNDSEVCSLILCLIDQRVFHDVKETGLKNIHEMVDIVTKELFKYHEIGVPTVKKQLNWSNQKQLSENRQRIIYQSLFDRLI